MLSDQIKPLSYLKSNAAEIISNFANDAEPLIITQNGEAKMVVMSIEAYERDRQSRALLKLLALGRNDIQEGRHSDAQAFFDEMGAD